MNLTGKYLSNLTTKSFWHRADGTIHPLQHSVGVDRVVETEESGTIFLTVRPSAVEFVANMRDGSLKIRFDSHTPTDPLAGHNLITAAGLSPFHISLERVDPLELGAEELCFKVQAWCELTWGVMDSPIEKENVDDNDTDIPF